MAKISSADLLDAFKEMTLLELSDFVKQFEETFEFTAAAPVAVAAAPAAGGGDGGAPAAEEQGYPSHTMAAACTQLRGPAGHPLGRPAAAVPRDTGGLASSR